MMKRPLGLILCGASGRMGSRVAALAAADARFSVLARVDLGFAGKPPWAEAGAIVDFSAPGASLEFVQAAARAKKPIVIGTTGFSSPQLSRLKAFSRRTPVFLSPNFSRGVAVMARLAAEAARLLPGYGAAVSEIHHDQKKDAPSGTALRLARAVQEGRKDGRPIPAVSQRLGDVVGDHTLTFAGPFERLELTHRAHSRDVFARGALEAALWVAGNRPGLYGMEDLMGLR